ncbi:MAG: hypothetical protein HEP80_20725 [Dolichospermum sp. UKL201]|nr:MAG: hypothetical protein HEP80_20725 [Dolichospermum sp. UKL201]
MLRPYSCQLSVVMDERELLDIVIINHYSTNSCSFACSLFPVPSFPN